jgi:hypothetical protein
MANLKDHFEDFLDQTQDERTRAEKRRDYRDLKQWTTAEAQVLEARGQAAIVFDQFGKKVDGLCGLEVDRRSDPKAYPVTPKHDKAAESITDALRYVEVASSFDEVASEVFEDKIVEGYGGVITEVEPKGDSFEIKINQIYWDRIYFDPFARRKDFKDAKYMGITLWMDEEDAVTRFPKKKDDIKNLTSTQGTADTTFDDRPNNWVDSVRKRVRVNQEYIQRGDKWVEVFYSGDVILQDERDSPYLDCDGVPSNPIELESDFLDRDNNRYGYTERLIDPQDEINHRRSKALHMLSSRTIITERGALGDKNPEEVLNDMKSGQSLVEVLPNMRFEIDNQQDLGQTQLGFYQDAQQSMDSIGANPELAGQSDSGASGRAIIALQQGGMVDLSRIFSRHFEWKRRVYEQVWSRIKQFWKEEKWVRVTDNDDTMRFVGLNIPVTKGEKMLEEQAGKSIDEIREQGGSEQVDQMLQEMAQQDPTVMEVVEKRNDVPRLDMDILLENAPDTLTIQQEQFDTLAQLAGTRADPQMFNALLKLSTLKNKDEVLELVNGSSEDAQQAQQAQAQMNNKMLELEMAIKQLEIGKTESEIAKNIADVKLKEAQSKDEMASAVERVGKTAAISQTNQV